MERRIFLGVRKNRPLKRIKKKKLLDYLTFDSYMFAPLISRPPPAFTSSNKKSVTEVEVKKPVRVKNSKKLIKKVSDYLKSNCYMYAPLLAQPRSIVSSSLYIERATNLEVSKRKVILEGYQPNEKLGGLEDRASKVSLPEEIVQQRSSVQQGTVKHKEAVKNTVHSSCRSSMIGRTVEKNRKIVVN